jgi:hypothetical protein
MQFLAQLFDRDTGKVFFATATGVTAAIQDISRMAKDVVPILSALYVILKLVFMISDRIKTRKKKHTK